MEQKEVKVSARPVLVPQTATRPVPVSQTATRPVLLSSSVRSSPSQLQKPGTNKPIGKDSTNSMELIQATNC